MASRVKIGTGTLVITQSIIYCNGDLSLADHNIADPVLEKTPITIITVGSIAVVRPQALSYFSSGFIRK